MQGEVIKKGKIDSKSEQAEMYSKNEQNLIDLEDDTHRKDQFSSVATRRQPPSLLQTKNLQARGLNSLKNRS
jgi:hypothetical protein